jgi:hypothetical protein
MVALLTSNGASENAANDPTDHLLSPSPYQSPEGPAGSRSAVRPEHRARIDETIERRGIDIAKV